ncbi:MAG: N-acetylmuramoyl-L-alanine amidase, partial [Campylobacterota bacterium]|nr:N-acetylmuramoyl-L-alanine amidase [Campylobacterota bacterium]
QMANKENADIFLSIHANSAPSKIEFKGLETYFLSPARSERAESVASKENATDLEVMTSESQKTFLSFLNREKVIASNKFAIDLQKNLLLNLKNNYSNIVDNGVREGPFWVLVGAQMPAVLLEIGYITHPKEAINLNSDDYQNIIAKGIADGIDSYFYHNQ